MQTIGRLGCAIAIGAAAAAACAAPPSLESALGSMVTLRIKDADNRGVSVASSGKRVVAAWAATANGVTDIYAAVSEDEGASFGAPIRVNDVSGDARVNGEQPPRVAAGKDIVVAWQSRRTGVSQVRLARSADAGRTFGAATTIHDTELTGARGWSSLVLDAEGVAHIAWLDGRNAHRRADASVGKPAVAAPTPGGSKPAPGGGHAHTVPTRQDIFQVIVRPDGATEESSVATNVCFCCKTSVATGPNSAVYVAWRHIYPVNLRDMAVASSTDGGKTFAAPVRVSEDGWQLEGCPEDGPSIAADASGRVHIAWPTIVDKAASRKGVFYSSSADGGRTFGARTRIDEGQDVKNAAHPQLTIVDGVPVIVWDESGPAGPRIRVRAVGQPAITAFEGEPVTYPAVAATPTGLVTAWTVNTASASEIRLRKVAIQRTR